MPTTSAPESLVHTNTWSPLTVPDSTKSAYEATVVPVAMSVARTSGSVACTTYTPFSVPVLWFFRRTRSPVLSTCPSSVEPFTIAESETLTVLAAFAGARHEMPAATASTYAFVAASLLLDGLARLVRVTAAEAGPEKVNVLALATSFACVALLNWKSRYVG